MRSPIPSGPSTRQRGLDASGAVGRALRLAPDVGTALRAFILNMHLHDRGYTLYCTDVAGRHHIHDGALDRETVAKPFALHPRTLNRRLRAEGTTFSALLAQVRSDIARELPRDTGLAVQDIGYALGYAGTAPFTVAFRGWSGMTAAAWRSLHRGK